MQEIKERYIVNTKGEKTAVVLPVEEYEELLEDLHDLAIIAERRDESTIPFEEIKKRLKKNGILNQTLIMQMILLFQEHQVMMIFGLQLQYKQMMIVFLQQTGLFMPKHKMILLMVILLQE